jgi:hypothetical protein
MTATALEHCANCDEAIGRLEPAHLWDDQVVCARCYRKLKGAASPAPEPNTATPAPPVTGPAVWVPPSARAAAPTGPLADERVFYSDPAITVTRSRIVYRGETFALANVSSVGNLRIDPDGSRYLWAIIGGVLFALVGCLFLAGGADGQACGAVVILGGLGLLAGGIYATCRLQTAYAMNVVTNAGERRISPHPDKRYIDKLVAAVNEAIAAR